MEKPHPAGYFEGETMTRRAVFTVGGQAAGALAISVVAAAGRRLRRRAHPGDARRGLGGGRQHRRVHSRRVPLGRHHDPQRHRRGRQDDRLRPPGLRGPRRGPGRVHRRSPPAARTWAAQSASSRQPESSSAPATAALTTSRARSSAARRCARSTASRPASSAARSSSARATASPAIWSRSALAIPASSPGASGNTSIHLVRRRRRRPSHAEARLANPATAPQARQARRGRATARARTATARRSRSSSRS